MNTNPEQLPNHFFDWLSQHSFDKLTPSQQDEVLQYCSKEMYNELYDTHQHIADNLIVSQDHARNKLLHRFDEKYPPSKKLNFTISHQLWKAASILLFMTTCLFAIQRSQRTEVLNDPIVLHDTIFIQQQVAHVTPQSDIDRIQPHQSVHKPKENHSSQEKVISQRTIHPTTHKELAQTAYPIVAKTVTISELNSVSIDHLENISNTNKRNSMKDDSLEKNFKFVSL